ncbi:hypothetical protein Cfor_06735 [Coptotermes formosanus]|uniref:Peptidase S1 domain-containing protein n=1 Tax=Coptotermes formosanus TaxID=36987 RepID=A0A6L2PH25_COPFO|nr:hypothetical protein Cfor_06735 [Coptotermes formosanus]
MTVISHFMFRLSAAELVILAGVLNNTLESTEDTKVVREVTDVFVHEEYDEDTLTNDIAVLKVSPAFPTDNPAVRPIRLRQDVATCGMKCTVSGWGFLGEKENTTPQILQVAIARLISYEECRSKYSNTPTASIKRGVICAGFLQGVQGACYNTPLRGARHTAAVHRCHPKERHKNKQFIVAINRHHDRNYDLQCAAVICRNSNLVTRNLLCCSSWTVRVTQLKKYSDIY